MIEGLLDLASAFGLSTSAGLNAYIPMLVVAVLAKFTGLIQLEDPWTALTSWWVIALLAVLLVVEEVADKIPAVDTVNDVVQTLVRPTAGAILFAATTQSSIRIHPLLAFGFGVVLAGGVHAVKAGARPAVTVMSAGMANPVVSTAEDAVSAITSLISVIFPYLVVAWFVLLGIAIYLIVRWRRRRRGERSV
ncbi:MAG: DUF4126 domain-containing protein [Anaerolineae bacterium]